MNLPKFTLFVFALISCLNIQAAGAETNTKDTAPIQFKGAIGPMYLKGNRVSTSGAIGPMYLKGSRSITTPSMITRPDRVVKRPAVNGAIGPVCVIKWSR